MKYIYSAFIVLIILISWILNRDPRYNFIVEEDYQGFICIEKGVIGAPPLEKDSDGFFVVRPVESGILKTSTPFISSEGYYDVLTRCNTKGQKCKKTKFPFSWRQKRGYANGAALLSFWVGVTDAPPFDTNAKTATPNGVERNILCGKLGEETAF